MNDVPIVSDVPIILIVDDHATNAAYYVAAVKSLGYHFKDAGNAEDARAILSENIFDLALIDWMMPGETGLSLVAWMKKEESHKDTWVIISTARSAEFEPEALAAGADDYIPKPIGIHSLLHRIQLGLKIVNLKRKIKELEASKPC